MAKLPFLPWRQSSASKYRPDTLNYGCISTSKSGEFSVGDANNKAVPVMPVGCVIPFAGAAAPTGWLLCQGQAVSRTTYAQLFSSSERPTAPAMVPPLSTSRTCAVGWR